MAYILDRLMILVTVYLAYHVFQDPMREATGSAMAAVQVVVSPFEKLSRALE
jgi:hypothetical protein